MKKRLDSGRPFPHTMVAGGQSVVGRLHVSVKALEQQNRLGSLGDRQIDFVDWVNAQKEQHPQKKINEIVKSFKRMGVKYNVSIFYWGECSGLTTIESSLQLEFLDVAADEYIHRVS